MTDKMTPETAIEIIKDMFCDGCQFVLCDGQYNDDGCIDCIWHLVKEALEKQIRLEEMYHNFLGYDLAKCVKYGNKNAKQQSQSYATVIMYEVANVFEDIIDWESDTDD